MYYQSVLPQVKQKKKAFPEIESQISWNLMVFSGIFKIA